MLGSAAGAHNAAANISSSKVLPQRLSSILPNAQADLRAAKEAFIEEADHHLPKFGTPTCQKA